MGYINGVFILDEKHFGGRMAENLIEKNALALAQEFEWFYKVLDTRIKLHFNMECEVSHIDSIKPSLIDNETSLGWFINHYGMSNSERIVFDLALIPHLQPQLLDILFTKNNVNGREFSEFGVRNGISCGIFLPTGLTALFLLAGENIQERLLFNWLFEPDHFFFSHGILSLSTTVDHEPSLSGYLTINKDIIDFVTTGSIKKPCFSPDFPARRITTALDWDDLVLDAETKENILELKAWLQYSATILDTLEMGKKLKPGYRALFHGPSGTGKTLTASIIGKITGKDVYLIDLSSVVSKYIGETEKNLEKIFRRADNHDWILFFDEADALFGKRTKVNDAHDRFANQEVSYLLQRVEEYSGLIILSTNLRGNIDDAFTRRFQSIIHFPVPKTSERYLIWKKAFSSKMQPENADDLHEIAASYEMSGGSIMNVVRYATLTALRNGKNNITKQYCMDGIRREFQKEGKTL
jgi:hypothetical protein